MNPENERTDEEYSGPIKVSTVCYSFRIEWKIPSNNRYIFDYDHAPRKMATVPPPLHFDRQEGGAMAVVGSKRIYFNDLKIPPFSLELCCKINTRGRPYLLYTFYTSDTKKGIELNYAFVTSGDRLYYLPILSKPYNVEVLDFMKGREVTEKILKTIACQQKYITIVCQVVAESDVQTTAENEGAVYLECSHLQKGSKHTNGIRTPSTSFSSTGSEAVLKHSLSGELPKLNVPLACELLRASEGKDNNAELRALSVEFLMRNLDPDNVVSVWTLAGNHAVKDLMEECSRYMTKYCKVMKQ